MLSAVLPVYNECNRLEACVSRLEGYLWQHYEPFEIIVAEDGSTDGSAEIARQIACRDPNVVLLQSDRRLGRGTSLAQALNIARGDYVVYMDADLATDLRHVRELVEGLANGATVATGSRLMQNSQAQRPAARDVASRGYNALVRLLFGSQLCDHQCGFKGFDRRAVLPLLGQVRDNHWFWDTELLIVCQKAGLRVCEFPVHWVHNGGDALNVSKVRVLRDSWQMGLKLLRLKYRLTVHGLEVH